MHYLRKRGFVFGQVDKLSLIYFISSIGLALVGSIIAIYFESKIHNPSYVGFIFTALTIFTGLTYIFSVPFFEKTSKTKIYVFALLMYIFSYFLFAFFSNLWIIVLLAIFISIVSALRITSFGIILRDKSKNKEVSQNVGVIYTFLNLAWLIGPLIAGFLSQQYGFRVVFILAAIVMAFSLFLFQLFKIKDNRISKKVDGNFFKILYDFFKDRNRRLNYVLSGGITFWLTLLYVYMPMYIIDSGLTKEFVGYFLALAVLPLISLEYYFGKLASKIGFKKIFFIGYIILGIFALLSFFVGNIYFVLVLIILGGVGISMLEPTTEAHFLDIVKANQRDKYYGPYNTTMDVNSAISSFLIAIILLFFSFKFIFLFVGIVMFLFALISLRIKNVVECRKKN